MDYENWYKGDQYPGPDSTGSHYSYWDYRESYREYEQSGGYTDVSLQSECNDVSFRLDPAIHQPENPAVEVEEAFHRDSLLEMDTVSADSESKEPPVPPKALPRSEYLKVTINLEEEVQQSQPGWECLSCDLNLNNGGNPHVRMWVKRGNFVQPASGVLPGVLDPSVTFLLARVPQGEGQDTQTPLTLYNI
ncbi:hypothetical protein P4O66_003098 [Electrophorus voltai]|uniref:Uncharacterized protein n=1 Tax=Electrophorus voltai TaxID=2609070 RepID=A0AAD8YPH0_9TELE|nr:hypothetical protein P4O66_003098 [Electrophorus voltai]